jgi:hypothetical protein
MVATNMIIECNEFLRACFAFSALEYITDPFNIVDTVHFVFLILTIAYWLHFWRSAATLNIPPSFRILNDVNTDVRPFLTNADQEFKFLQFMDRLHAVSDALALYSVYAGVCVLLFVCRILKSLDFQERMGLVTKTIQVASFLTSRTCMCVFVCVCMHVRKFECMYVYI